MRRFAMAVAFAALLAGAAACTSKSSSASAPEGKLYSVEASARPAEVSSGEKGAVDLRLKLAQGAHLSEEAPFKIQVTGQGLAPVKARLGREDGAPSAGKEGVTQFELPFTAQDKGPASLGADMEFYVCTASLCEQHRENVQVSVRVK